MTAALMIAAILVPLAAALVVLPRPTRGIGHWLALWAPLPALLAALVPPDLIEIPWLQLGSMFNVTPTTRPLLLVTAILWLAAAHYADGYLADDPRRTRFTAFFMLTLTGNIGLLLARDVPTFYLFFALMTFAAYGLVIHTGSASAHRAARVYIAMAVFGEALLLPGMVLAVAASGSLLIADAPAAIAGAANRDTIVALLLAGFGVKAGMLGLHMWLPLAHPIAPTPASAVLSGAMIKAGVLGWLQFVGADPALAPWLVPLAAWGLTAAYVGVVFGLLQDDPKAMLAYSSVSQIGLMLVAIALGFGADTSPSSAHVTMFYAAHHGLAKGALFLAIGVVAATAASARLRTAVLVMTAVPALALIGAPWTSGAAAKALLVGQLAGGAVPLWIKPGLAVAAVGTGLLMARLLWVLARLPRSADRLDARVGAAALALAVASGLAALLLPWAVVVAPVADPAAAAGPLAAAMVMAAVAYWALRGSRLAAWRVPPGDVVNLVRLDAARPALVAAVAAVSTAVTSTWNRWMVRARRLRRRWIVEIGREERAFPIAAGTLTAATLLALAALLMGF